MRASLRVRCASVRRWRRRYIRKTAALAWRRCSGVRGTCWSHRSISRHCKAPATWASHAGTSSRRARSESESSRVRRWRSTSGTCAHGPASASLAANTSSSFSMLRRGIARDRRAPEEAVQRVHEQSALVEQAKHLGQPHDRIVGREAHAVVTVVGAGDAVLVDVRDSRGREDSPVVLEQRVEAPGDRVRWSQSSCPDPAKERPRATFASQR